MVSVLHHGKAEPEHFRERNRVFIERFGSLQHLVQLAFDRDPPSQPADLMVFGLGRRVAADFDDILVLCSERRAENALALLRAMFERLITARYIHNHPDEAPAFAEYDYVQRRKTARRIKDVLGLSAEHEEKMRALEEYAARVEEHYRVADCKKCGTTKINHTWNKLDVVAMVSHTEKPSSELQSEKEKQQAAQTSERLTKMTLFGYYNPMGHTHATLKSISSAFEEKNGKLIAVLPKYEDIDSTLELAHLLLLESLLIQGDRFPLTKFKEAHDQAMHDFNDIWHASNAENDEHV